MGNFDIAEHMLDGHGLMQFIESCPGHDDIAYAKFAPGVDHAARAFATAPVPNEIKG